MDIPLLWITDCNCKNLEAKAINRTLCSYCFRKQVFFKLDLDLLFKNLI